jgi:Protein of unknown function (DUF1453)
MGLNPPPGASLTSYLVPLGVILLVVLLRNSRARSLKIERLWVLPAIYMAMLVSALYAEPPPVTVLSIAILVLSFLIGAGIGWQRGRFTQVHIHPETGELSSRASPIGLIFIFAILAVRIVGRNFLTTQASGLHLPILAVTDGFFVLAVSMLSVQRLEVWMRASRMLAEARAAGHPPPPSSLVS